MPLVSVVIPTFGRPALLERAVRSVLAQTMADLELFVVIDGDDPATVAMLAAIPDPRLHAIVHSANKGAGEARNTGIDAANGNWIAFLDDDDEWLPEKLALQLAAAPVEPAVLMTRSRVVTPDGDFIRPAAPYAGDRPVDEWLFSKQGWLKGGDGFIQASSLMFPRAALATLRFEPMKAHEDWEIVLRAVKQLGYPLATAPEPLVIHYFGEVRPSLSQTFTWKRSLDWADAVGDLLSPRAYSGFCLIFVARVAAAHGRYSAILPLLRAAFRKGRPTGPQLLAFLLLWAMPTSLRKKVRALLQGERKKTAPAT
jgi:glycosyltransferase involved in cell wall biosynthesis